MPRVENELRSLREDLTSLNSSVNDLSMCFEEHKNRSAAELAGLTIKMETLDSKVETLDSKVETLDSKMETLDSKVETLDSNMQSSQDTSFITEVKDELRSLREDLTNLNSSVNSKIDSKMETLDSNMQSSQENHTQQICAKLDTLTATTAQLSTEHQNLQTDISDVECTDSEESLEIYQNLQNNLTHQLESISDSLEHLAVHTCGGTGGWRRVVYLDMTDSSTTCPSGWQLTGYSKRTCGRVSTGSYSCDSATFLVSGGEYTRVCGRIKAYQWGVTVAFYNYHNGYRTTIDGGYVDGVSVTHGSPQQHIWTFAAGAAEGSPTWTWVCPCDASIDIRVPPFVGEDYFCESGVNGVWRGSRHHSTFFSTDTLWDGEDCLPSSTCCSQHNPPYFIKQLPTPTTDDIEARVCFHWNSSNGNIAVELVELYVQ